MATRHLFELLVLVVAVYATPFILTPELLDDAVQYRLPTSIVPTKYTIDLIFTEETFTEGGNTFTGNARIDFKINEEVTELKLHVSHDYITIPHILLNNYDLYIDKGDYSIDETTDILTIPNAMGLTPKSYYMVIDYTATISTTDIYGLYKSSYTNSKKETVYLLATQFQATYARRAFPCFDEPSFKATFDVSVTLPSKLSTLGVLFNTEEKSRAAEGELTKITFQTTPVMSSYLVGLVISDFTSTNGANVEGDNVPYVIWSRNDVATSREYAKGIGPTILQKLNDYTGRNYGTDISKVAQVALPDLAPEAMENWGLVTYRERELLWNEADNPNAFKQTIATSITHEFAHQWFGNLITCNWWSETFLNEGLATYFEYFITHQVEPSWELDKQFVVNTLQKVLNSDASEYSQALQSEASSPQEVSEKFGGISYNKGASIIRMVSYVMGEESFKKGIQEYVQSKDLQHSTTTPAKLWEALQKHVDTANLPKDTTLTVVMQNWIEKSGYPLLTVSLDGKQLKISQERFLLTAVDKDTKWYVPVTYAESGKAADPITYSSTWLTSTDTDITVDLENENEWVLVNTFQKGYFRVNYDNTLWDKLAAALKKEEFDGIDELNRAQIVDDLFNLAKVHKVAYADVFSAIEFLQNDVSYYSWVPAFNGFSYITQKIPDKTDLKQKLQEHLLSLMDKLYKSVPLDTIKDDDQIYTLTQVLASSWACSMGEQSCVASAKNLFADYKANGVKPNKNLRSVVYCNALRHSEDVSDYEFLWNLYASSELASEKSTILWALGCSNNADKRKELLSETIKKSTDSKIRAQDAISAFAAVYSGSADGVSLALDFFVDNFADIFEKYASMSARSSLLKGLAERITSHEQLDKLIALIGTNPEFPTELLQLADETLVQAQSNLDWIENQQADLENYYGINDDGSTTASTTDSTTDSTTGSTTDSPGKGSGSSQINVIMLCAASFVPLLTLLRR